MLSEKNHNCKSSDIIGEGLNGSVNENTLNEMIQDDNRSTILGKNKEVKSARTAISPMNVILSDDCKTRESGNAQLYKL